MYRYTVPPSADFQLTEFDLPGPERRKLATPQYRRQRKKMNSFVREAAERVGPCVVRIDVDFGGGGGGGGGGSLDQSLLPRGGGGGGGGGGGVKAAGAAAAAAAMRDGDQVMSVEGVQGTLQGKLTKLARREKAKLKTRSSPPRGRAGGTGDFGAFTGGFPTKGGRPATSGSIISGTARGGSCADGGPASSAPGWAGTPPAGSAGAPLPPPLLPLLWYFIHSCSLPYVIYNFIFDLNMLF